MSSKPAFTRAQPEERRADLVEAAARVLARSGASGATVRAIAVEADVSPGLIGHYFGGVDALVAATYAHVEAQVAEAIDDSVASAGADPRARLDAFVTVSFAPPVARADLLATWTAFWSLVRSNADIARQHDEQYAAFRIRLERLLAECGLPEARRYHAAIAITALIDGLWLELCLSPQAFSAEDAGMIARSALDALVG